MDGSAGRPDFLVPTKYNPPRMSYAARKAPGLPKLKDLNRRQRQDIEVKFHPDVRKRSL